MPVGLTDHETCFLLFLWFFLWILVWTNAVLFRFRANSVLSVSLSDTVVWDEFDFQGGAAAPHTPIFGSQGGLGPSFWNLDKSPKRRCIFVCSCGKELSTEDPFRITFSAADLLHRVMTVSTAAMTLPTERPPAMGCTSCSKELGSSPSTKAFKAFLRRLIDLWICDVTTRFLSNGINFRKWRSGSKRDPVGDDTWENTAYQAFYYEKKLEQLWRNPLAIVPPVSSHLRGIQK